MSLFGADHESTPRFLRAAFMAGLFIALAHAANAQSRVEGTVVWADGSPAAGLTVSIRDPTLRTTTDARGRYGFDDVRAGIRVTVTVALGQTLLATRDALVTLRVERVDVALPATQDPPESPKFQVGMSTNFNIIQAQRDLAAARNGELQAVLAYRKAIVELDRLQQTTSQPANLTVVSASSSTSSSKND